MTWQHQGNLWGTDLKVVCCSLWKICLCVVRTIPTLPVSASLKILLLDTPKLVHSSKGLWPDPAGWLWPRLMKIPFLTALYAKPCYVGEHKWKNLFQNQSQHGTLEQFPLGTGQHQVWQSSSSVRTTLLDTWCISWGWSLVQGQE